MSKPKMMRVPSWVTPEDYQRFALRLAALYFSKDGSMGTLSQALGYTRPALQMALNYKGLNAQHCIKLEELLGRDHFPREFFRPDIFLPE